MKDKIKNKEYFVIAILFILMIIINWNYLKGYNCYDTYKMHRLGYQEYAKELFFADGRIFSGIYILIADVFNIFQTDYYIFSMIITIFIVIINVVYLKNLIVKTASKNLNIYLVYALAFITVFNFSYVDNIRFIEMPIIALSILLYMIAAKQAVIDKNITKMLITLLFAIFMYQGTINVFFMMTVFLLLQEHRSFNKNIILEEIKILSFSAIPIIINYLYMQIYGFLYVNTQRTTTQLPNLFEKFCSCLITLNNVIIYTKSIMPQYFYFGIILITITLTFIFLLKDKKKNIFDVYINMIVLIIVALISCLPIILLFDIADLVSLTMCGRIFWAIGAIYGLMLIELYLNTDIFENKLYKIIFMAFIIIHAFVLYSGIYNMEKINRYSNEVDKNLCYTIKQNIESYEEKNNCKVEKLKIKIESSPNGLREEHNDIELEHIFMKACLPLTNLLEFYCGLEIDTSYIGDNVTNFKSKLDFYYEGNIAYLYMEI